MRNLTRTAIAAIAAATVLGLTGCDTVEPAKVSDAPATTTAPASSSDDEAVDEVVDEPVEDGTAAFGQTYTYEDGMAVRISKPKPFTPGEYDYIPKGATTFRIFKVTITNGTAKPFDPNLAHVTVAAAGAEGEQLYAESVGSAPSTKIRPGKSVTYSVAFGLRGTSDLTVEVAPDMVDYASVLYGS